MVRKILIVTGVLISEASDAKDEKIEAEIRARLCPESIRWCERIERITVLSES